MTTADASSDPTLQGVVAVGASAGGVEALTRLVAALPADLPYALLVALHMPARSPSVLARILDRSGPLPAVTATDGERLEAGRIYVSVPDRHLLVRDHRIVLSEGPTENGHRPAINALFRSVALASGHRGVGVLLSGVLDDGVLGLAAIRSRGGCAFVQEPTEALFSAMPQNAIAAGVVDRTLLVSELGAHLTDLANRDLSEEQEMEPDATLQLENRIAMGTRFDTAFDPDELGPPAGFSCPDCNGSLLTVGENNFRCQVGHAWTAESLLTAQDAEVENALWIAIRGLQEKARLLRRVAERAGPGISQGYLDAADEADRAVKVLGDRMAQTYRESGVHDAG